jgi:hypothetical protein
MCSRRDQLDHRHHRRVSPPGQDGPPLQLLNTIGLDKYVELNSAGADTAE